MFNLILIIMNIIIIIIFVITYYMSLLLLKTKAKAIYHIYHIHKNTFNH